MQNRVVVEVEAVDAVQKIPVPPLSKLELEVPVAATTAGPVETIATTKAKHVAANCRGIKTMQLQKTRWAAHHTHLHEPYFTIV